ncbi:MAG TPA: uracil-DNA glycosylase family protein [Stellaceae bacterium]|nr:uracil-DNA glycosylase family protein [Stellaceae bacterium]
MPTPVPPAPDTAAALALLQWQIEMGADEAIGPEAISHLAVNRLAPPPPATRPVERPAPTRPAAPTYAPTVTAPPRALTESAAEPVQSARMLAAQAQTVEALAALIAGFDACPLKRTATNTVFADGNPQAPVMIIGEAPGADEDRIGKPFVGRAGQLLDRMLAAIGLDRTRVQITNVIYWRPPGNRKPTAQEIASCLPFVFRHIVLSQPKVLVLAGGTAASALLPMSEGITRLRGRWFDLAIPGLDAPLPTLPMFHPAYLLRTPERKREAWRDLLALKAKLSELGVS